MVAYLKWGWQSCNGPWHLYIYRSLLDLSTFLIFFCFRRVDEEHFIVCYWSTAVSAVWLELFCFFLGISHLSFTFARFFFRETAAMVLLRERTLWSASRYLSTSRVGFSTVCRRSNYIWRSSVRLSFGKIKFSLTFSSYASPLFPFSLAVLCDTPQLANTWPEFGPPRLLLKEYLASEF